MNSFAKLLPELLREYGGSKKALARAVHITPSSLSHLAASKASPSVAVCLRFAIECRTNASRILRAAGKADVADLIEDLYGDPAKRRVDRGPRFTTDEEERTYRLRARKPTFRRAIDVLLAAAEAAEANAITIAANRQTTEPAAAFAPVAVAQRRRA